MKPGLLSSLDLPAELCELIYEVLFQRQEHVLLHNRDVFSADFFHPRKAASVRNEVSILPIRPGDSSPQPTDWELAKKTEFFDGVWEGVQLLVTCR